MNENQPTQQSQRMTGIVNRLNKMIAKTCDEKIYIMNMVNKNQTKQQSQLVRETQLTDKQTRAGTPLNLTANGYLELERAENRPGQKGGRDPFF